MRLGINSSLIRPHYELSIVMVASSMKKKSRLGILITIRENKQSVGSASNMIPCFPVSNGTDAHRCDTISNRSSPSHFTKDMSF